MPVCCYSGGELHLHQQNCIKTQRCRLPVIIEAAALRPEVTSSVHLPYERKLTIYLYPIYILCHTGYRVTHGPPKCHDIFCSRFPHLSLRQKWQSHSLDVSLPHSSCTQFIFSHCCSLVSFLVPSLQSQPSNHQQSRLNSQDLPELFPPL